MVFILLFSYVYINPALNHYIFYVFAIISGLYVKTFTYVCEDIIIHLSDSIDASPLDLIYITSV